MTFHWTTFILQTINFVVLVWLLHRFLYKPVLRLADSRQSEIDANFAEARSLESKAKTELATIEARRANIAVEREQALKAAAEEAETSAKTLTLRAENDAAAMLEQTRRTLATERKTALAEVRRTAADLGLEIARRLLADIPSGIPNDAWLEKMERHISGLSKTEIDELSREVNDAAPLRIVTTAPLPAASMDRWRSRLNDRFRPDLPVAFEVDPTLGAGVELHFPSSVLHFSWKSELEHIREEILSRADDR